MLLRCTVLSFLLILVLSSLTAVADKPDEAKEGVQDDACVSTDAEGDCTAKYSSSSVYVIGDLHGDAICAVTWVNRTGLIANLFDKELLSSTETTLPLYKKLSNPSEWGWTNDNAKLVFMGDYVDKGPTSRQTVEFVKDLTTAFPDRVTAILGNHELELLRDREAPSPVDRYSAYSYATVHPGEYHNYFHPKQHKHQNDSDAKDKAEGGSTKVRALDEKDDLVLDLLYEASLEVYAHRAHSAVRFVPELPNTESHRQRGIKFAITDIIPPQHRLLARERLAEYADAYMNAFRSGTVLGDWVEQRPIMHLAEDINTLFVHGGVSHDIGNTHLAKGKEGVEKFNSVFYKNTQEGKLYNFLRGMGSADDKLLGYEVYSLLTYRGNHPGYSKWER